MNTVAPLADESCTIPFTAPRYSDFTGTT